MADEGLLDLCVRGDEGAWRELIRSYGGFVAATVRRVFERVGRREGSHEVEEAVCDFFGDLWMRRAETLGRFRGECSLRAFLAVLAANCARTRAMSNRRGCDQVATYLQVAAAQVMESRPPDMEIDAGRTASVLERCAGHEKLLFRLLYVEEASVDHACAVLGISRDALYLRKHRFLRRVRRLLVVAVIDEARRPEPTAGG